MATNAQRAQGKIMMVGSLPFETVEEGLRAVGSKLGGDVIAIPDGEVGPRKMWCMFLASDTYSKHPDLVETRRPSPAMISNEEKPVGTKKRGRAPPRNITGPSTLRTALSASTSANLATPPRLGSPTPSFVACATKASSPRAFASRFRWSPPTAEPTFISMTLTTGQWFTRPTYEQ